LIRCRSLVLIRVHSLVRLICWLSGRPDGWCSVGRGSGRCGCRVARLGYGWETLWRYVRRLVGGRVVRSRAWGLRAARRERLCRRRCLWLGVRLRWLCCLCRQSRGLCWRHTWGLCRCSWWLRRSGRLSWHGARGRGCSSGGLQGCCRGRCGNRRDSRWGR